MGRHSAESLQKSHTHSLTHSITWASSSGYFYINMKTEITIHL